MFTALPFQLDDQTQIYIESDESLRASGGVQLVSKNKQGVANFSQAAENALPAARVMVDKLQSLVDNVQEIEVQFGIKFSGQVGALIAKTGTEANFNVKLVWKPTSD